MKTTLLQLRNELADGIVNELDFAEQWRARRSHCVQIPATADILLDQFLPYAHGLEVHAEDLGDFGFRGMIVSEAVDFIEDRVDLQCVVALDGHKTVRVRAELVLVWIG